MNVKYLSIIQVIVTGVGEIEVIKTNVRVLCISLIGLSIKYVSTICVSGKNVSVTGENMKYKSAI